MHSYHIGLVGDSDIARWPISLLPNIAVSSSSSTTTNTNTSVRSASGSGGSNNCSNVLVSGHSDMTLHQILPHVKDTITTLLQCDDSSCTNRTNKFIVVCAGENDIGCGIPLSTSKVAFQSLLDLFHDTNTELSQRQWGSTGTTGAFIPQHVVHLLFLGPKLEPWLRNDNATRKSYLQMSLTFEKLCHQQRKKNITLNDLNVEYLHYINCLTMFCGEVSSNQPGALYGRKAIPEAVYFHSDQLHLSDEGYTVWKSKIEDKISLILSMTRQEHDD